MKNIENIDKLFSNGMEEYTVTPSPEVKKKLFSSPEAIKPNQPWYINKGFYWAISFIAVSSLLLYLGFFYNNDVNKTSSLNYKNTSNVAVLNNSNTVSKTNDVNENEEHKTQSLQNKNREVQPKNIVSNSLSIKKRLKNQTSLPKPTENKTYSTKQIQKPAHPEKTEITENAIHKNKTTLQPSTENKPPVAEVTSGNMVPTADKNIKTSSNKNSVAENRTDTKENIEINSAAQNTTISFPEDKTILLFMKSRSCLLPIQPTTDSIRLKPENISYYPKGLWYIEAASGLFISNYKVTTDNYEWKPARDAKQQMLKPSLGYNVEVNAVYQQKRWVFKGGINYANYGEKLNCSMVLANPHQAIQITYNGGYYEAYINGIYYDIDSTSYEHYTYTQTNHIYATDSTLAWDTHFRPVDVTDTTQVTRFDTLPKATLYNHISYVEMPLSVGFAFPHGRFSFILSANIVPGYFVSVTGLQMNTNYYPALEPYEQKTIRKFTLSAGFGLEMDYRLNETWIFGVEPFYQKSLWNIYSNDYKINQRLNNYGFRISIKKLL